MKKNRQLFTPKRLKALFYLIICTIALLIAYRGYIVFLKEDFSGVHAEQIETIQNRLEGREKYRFAVVGNINNSIGIFERKIIPILNKESPSFIVSAGNAVSGGGEDKYQALYGSLTHLEIPYLLTVGEHETRTFGSYHFYEHFGPYFYSFIAGSSQFLFLDCTDPDTYQFQLHWLEDQLQNPRPKHRFLFISKPLLQPDSELSTQKEEDIFLQDSSFRESLMQLIKDYGVDAVFSTGLPVFNHQQKDGVHHVVTGGAGGLVLHTKESYYHFAEVQVKGDNVSISEHRLDIGSSKVERTIESLWFFIYSLFYVGWLNFLLVLLVLAAVSIKLYSSVFVDRDYYPNFDIDPSPYQNTPLRIAMLTDNYLPFIGGVPISIDRLKRGLQALAHSILIIAPSYPGKDNETESEEAGDGKEVERIPSHLSWGTDKEFRLANILSPKIRRRLTEFKPHLIHSHHPFWTGWAARRQAKRLGVPLVYTYHTRLEHYAHFVPLPSSLFRNLISHALVRRYANRCHGIIVPTGSAEEYLRLIGVTTDIYVQPTGIEFEKFQKRDTDIEERIKRTCSIDRETVLLTVSRLSREKNIDFLIEGIGRVHTQTSTPFKCLIIGDGVERGRLQNRIEELGLEETVYLLGPVPPEEMSSYYHIGDIFLFASRSETQGMVILEAMSGGMPVVAVRSSGIDDVVKNDVNGYKTPEDLEEWTTRVNELLENEKKRKTLSEGARDFARHFSISKFAKNVSDIYAHVLASYYSDEHKDKPS